jgi:membrane protein
LPGRIRTTAGLFRDTIERCIKHNTSLLSAALAFYALLSLAPALYFVVAAAGVVIGRSAARDEVMSWSAQMLGSGGARFIGEVLDRGGSASSFATIAGVVSLAYGATVAFGALQDALNLIWEVPPRQGGYIKQFFVKRLVSFLAVMIVGVLLLVSLLTDAITAAASKLMPQSLPASTEFLLRTANFTASLILVTVLFALLYRVLPDSWVAWRDVWTGAAITALLFSTGKALIGLYLGHSTTSTPFGAAGSVVIFLLWVYYSAQIFLFGAEFTEVYAVVRRARAASLPKSTS